MGPVRSGDTVALFGPHFEVADFEWRAQQLRYVSGHMLAGATMHVVIEQGTPPYAPDGAAYLIQEFESVRGQLPANVRGLNLSQELLSPQLSAPALQLLQGRYAEALKSFEDELAGNPGLLMDPRDNLSRPMYDCMRELAASGSTIRARLENPPFESWIEMLRGDLCFILSNQLLAGSRFQEAVDWYARSQGRQLASNILRDQALVEGISSLLRDEPSGVVVVERGFAHQRTFFAAAHERGLQLQTAARTIPGSAEDPFIRSERFWESVYPLGELSVAQRAAATRNILASFVSRATRYSGPELTYATPGYRCFAQVGDARMAAWASEISSYFRAAGGANPLSTLIAATGAWLIRAGEGDAAASLAKLVRG